MENYLRVFFPLVCLAINMLIQVFSFRFLPGTCPKILRREPRLPMDEPRQGARTPAWSMHHDKDERHSRRPSRGNRIPSEDFRTSSNIGLLNSLFLGFISGVLLLSILELRISLTGLIPAKETIALFIAHLITYVSMGYCYFHFVNLSETARRIRILRELRDSPEGLDLDQLLARYNARDIIERRIQRLIKNGQIILKNDKYYIAKPVMLLIANILLVLKWIILGKKSEFD